jgi:hypothetical protein
MKLTRFSYEIVAGQSTASNYTSQAYEVMGVDVEALQVNYTGSPTGTFAVQGSSDYKEVYNPDGTVTILNAGEWANLYYSVNGGTPAASVAVPTYPSPIIFDTYGSGVGYLRIVWTGSGTGTFSAYITAKRLGD